VARPFLPLPRLPPARFSASRIAFATFTLTLRLFFSLCLSYCYSPFPPSSVSRSLEQPLLACRFFSSPPRSSFLTVGNRPRPLVLYRPGRFVPPIFPHIRPARICTPLQKTQVQCGRNGGFLPSFPFTLFPSFLLYLSLNLFPSLPLLPYCADFLLSSVPLLFCLSCATVLYLRFVRLKSVALSHFIVYLKIASLFHPSTSDSQPSLEHRWFRDYAFFVELEKSSFVLPKQIFTNFLPFLFA